MQYHKNRQRKPNSFLQTGHWHALRWVNLYIKYYWACIVYNGTFFVRLYSIQYFIVWFERIILQQNTFKKKDLKTPKTHTHNLKKSQNYRYPTPPPHASKQHQCVCVQVFVFLNIIQINITYKNVFILIATNCGSSCSRTLPSIWFFRKRSQFTVRFDWRMCRGCRRTFST